MMIELTIDLCPSDLSDLRSVLMIELTINLCPSDLTAVDKTDYYTSEEIFLYKITVDK